MVATLLPSEQVTRICHFVLADLITCSNPPMHPGVI